MKKKRRPISLPEKRMNGGLAVSPTMAAFANVCTSARKTSTPFVTTAAVKMEVKTERLSPASATTDNSSGSGSNTPSSLYSETPPGANSQSDRIPSLSLSSASRSKMNDQPMARNYSDIMRSLAAKYNNTNPNDYYTKNGLTFNDPRFSLRANAASPFVNLVTSGNSSPTSSCHQPMASANAKETNDFDLKHVLEIKEAQNDLFSSFALHSFNTSLPLFPPLIDMGSTQALFNMVRNPGTGDVIELENYTKNASSVNREAIATAVAAAAAAITATEMVNNPLDLSSNASMAASKKLKRRASGELVDNTTTSVAATAAADRTKDRVPASIRPDSVSPKLRTKSVSSKDSVQVLDRQSAAVAATAAANCPSLCATSAGRTNAVPSRVAARVENVSDWSIDDVHNFVSSIDICSEYADNFREQCIDGISLPLLTEEHLKTTMNMKLGPALKFKALLTQKIGNCTVCMHCLHCHSIDRRSENGISATNGKSLTPVPTNSLSFNLAVIRPNSTEH